MKIKDLPPEIKAKAIANIKQQGKEYKEYRHTVTSAFTWDKSPEGVLYWQEIAKGNLYPDMSTKPDKFAVMRTEENSEQLNAWFSEKIGRSYTDKGRIYQGEYSYMHYRTGSKNYTVVTRGFIQGGFKEISFEEFKQHFLTNTVHYEIY